MNYSKYHVLLARLVVAAMKLPIERRRPLFNKWKVHMTVQRPELWVEAERYAAKQVAEEN